MTTVPISTIVPVTITRQTKGVKQAGFGIPLILGNNANFGGGVLVRQYLSLDEVTVDFASSTDEYKAASAVFAQNPKVEKVKIGKQGTFVAQVQTFVLSADLVAVNTVAVTVDGTPVSQLFNVDHITTMNAFAASIQALPGVATAVVGGVGNRTITITAQTPGVPVTLTLASVTGGASQATITITTTVANVGVGEGLTAIGEQDDSWFGLIWTERTKELVLTAAQYIETKKKIFITCSSDSGILNAATTTDIAYLLSTSNYEHTAIVYNATPTKFPDAAWMGVCFTFDPGEETWKFKTLSGITADNLTSTQRSAAQGKDCNLYVNVGGIDMTQEGVMSSGEYIDVIRGVFWVEARMSERIFSKLVNLPKIPFTNDGIAIVEAEVRAVLENGIRVKLLSNDPLPDNERNDKSPYRIIAPKVNEISTNDKATRLLPDVKFVARLAGAIHKITINGIVTV